MSGRDLHDDDALLVALGRAVGEGERGSSGAGDLARAAGGGGRGGGELGARVSDSYADHGAELAVRAGEETDDRLLAYEGDGLGLELDLPAGDPRVIGQVELSEEITGPVEVDLLSTGGSQTLEVDDLGRFQSALPGGRVRIVVRAGGVAMTTPWITR